MNETKRVQIPNWRDARPPKKVHEVLAECRAMGLELKVVDADNRGAPGRIPTEAEMGFHVVDQAPDPAPESFLLHGGTVNVVIVSVRN